MLMKHCRSFIPYSSTCLPLIISFVCAIVKKSRIYMKKKGYEPCHFYTSKTIQIPTNQKSYGAISTFRSVMVPLTGYGSILLSFFLSHQQPTSNSYSPAPDPSLLPSSTKEEKGDINLTFQSFSNDIFRYSHKRHPHAVYCK